MGGGSQLFFFFLAKWSFTLKVAFNFPKNYRILISSKSLKILTELKFPGIYTLAIREESACTVESVEYILEIRSI